MPVLDAGDHPLAWREAGAGPPALLLHCALAHSGAFAGLMASLAGSLAMRAPDLPGHGGTGRSATGSSQDQALADARLLTEGFAPVHLVGHSFGGTVALRLAVEAPERVASLTLIEPVQFSLVAETDPAALAAEVAAQSDYLGAAAAGDWPAATRAFVGRWGSLPEDPERARYMVERMHLVTEEAAVLGDPSRARVHLSDLARLPMPVLLVSGAQSPPVVVQILDAIAAALPRARRVVIPGAGHMAPITHPGAVAAAIAALVAEA